MTVFLSVLAGFCAALILVWSRFRFASFRAQTPADMTSLSPVFDLPSHLNGPILCEGVIFGPTGRVASRFVADMHGRWTGSVGTLDEVFRYDSGTVQHRCWTLALVPENRIEATAPDVPGMATGSFSGSGVVLRYRIRLAPEAGGHLLNVIDWMYLLENGTIINRSQFSKFGIVVAELVATLRKVPG